ncbi:acetyl-CoA carboxylase biotin carboxylase subunit [Lacticigenium naphthae]|uniref:acetyl-CoA carboxylase biotin carboxylase subunit n=1 Tax=Lacticigenium naphthae TaxID=515351 RepID=UPI00040EBC0C|nr:acetyl-CoA carboxylase biotin carboxylase subunit [Lacticigenium naphthae]
MFKKILIANRGEIAVRIIRACRELGIQTVAVYSTADQEAMHTQLADEAICIGPSKAIDSYLNMQNILSAAVLTQAQAIHPGFGFLSENSTFASMCEEMNITFIGPDKETIDQMGNKAHARKLMKAANVPVVPGSEGFLEDETDVVKNASEISYPLMLKAAAGGGGKGMRVVQNETELMPAFHSAQSEAQAAFGDGRMYMEKIIKPAKHIEVQLLADHFGNVIHLGERDCSMQRHHQKVIEESPAVLLSESQRKAIGDAAVRAGEYVGYKNAGTVEFLVDQSGDFYFMEMNTRIQVEHPITEMVTGIDIVKEQLRIASGEPLSVRQSEIIFNGHAIECRINAENPLVNFAPSPGKISYLLLPSGGLGLRVDSALFAESEIPPYYDAMVAKVITHGKNREEAIAKMKRALGEMVIEGIQTNQDFQMDLLDDLNFRSGDYYTTYLEDEFIEKWLVAKDEE